MNTIFDGFEIWSAQDREASYKEGWSIFNVRSTGVLEILACNVDGSSPDAFSSDDEARAHVAKKAAEGSPLHMRSLLALAATIVQRQIRDTCEKGTDIESGIKSLDGAHQSYRNNIQWSCSYAAMSTLLRTAYFNGRKPCPIP